MLHRYQHKPTQPGEHAYTRLWQSCDICSREGEPVFGATDDDVKRAFHNAGLQHVDVNGQAVALCGTCRASQPIARSA